MNVIDLGGDIRCMLLEITLEALELPHVGPVDAPSTATASGSPSMPSTRLARMSAAALASTLVFPAAGLGAADLDMGVDANFGSFMFVHHAPRCVR